MEARLLDSLTFSSSVFSGEFSLLWILMEEMVVLCVLRREKRCKPLLCLGDAGGRVCCPEDQPTTYSNNQSVNQSINIQSINYITTATWPSLLKLVDWDHMYV
jgi:hypothetical protein